MADVATSTLTLTERFAAAKDAARPLATATTEAKNRALSALALAVTTHAEEIITANEADIERGRETGLAPNLVDRLTLTAERIAGLADAVNQIVSLTDPVGQAVRGSVLPNGIRVEQVRVPFGVVGAIYEARPNVTVDIAALAVKSGNAIVLRGGSAAQETNRVLVGLIRQSLAAADLPADAVQTVDDFGREGAKALMRARGYVDVLVPRGSAGLIETVVTESTVPVIETGSGVVHLFVDESAPTDRALAIAHNAKVQRPSVCNAAETILVHERAARRIVAPLVARLQEAGVRVHGDRLVAAAAPGVAAATDEDWAAEYLSLDVAIRIVESLDDALAHIRTYSTGHTEAIVTESVANSERFLAEVDSAVVMVNASTRFTDGGEFGFGAEVGISTQKLHARGPMGLAELTSTKWLVRGNGQIRP